MRSTFTSRDLRAACFICHGPDAHWTGANAQALAARHHDSTGHPTWCDVMLSIRYGRDAPDDRQTDIEDAIRSTAAGGAASSGDRPTSTPLTDPEAPAVAAAGESAAAEKPQDRPFETRAARSRRSRSKPEHAHV